MKKITIPNAKACHLCGDRRRVMRGLIDKTCGLPTALELVTCPKCGAFGENRVKKLIADAAKVLEAG